MNIDKIQNPIAIEILERNSITKTNLSIEWVPSHIGIKGNEIADIAAKLGLQKRQPDINIKYIKTEVKSIINGKIEKEWRKRLEHIYNRTLY